jgi:hypothetical protein
MHSISGEKWITRNQMQTMFTVKNVQAKERLNHNRIRPPSLTLAEILIDAISSPTAA